MPTKFPYNGFLCYCRDENTGQWEPVKLQDVPIEDENHVRIPYSIEPITMMEFQLTMKISTEQKAYLAGFKNVACYNRAIRRLKRKKEKLRRERLKGVNV